MPDTITPRIKRPPMSVKLKCHTCNKTITRQQSKSGKFTKNFCNERCMWDNRIRWIGYIVANYTTKKPAEIATHIDIPVNTFRTWVFCMNKMLMGYVRVVFPKGPEGIKDGLTNNQRSDLRKKQQTAIRRAATAAEKEKVMVLTAKPVIKLKKAGKQIKQPEIKNIVIAENSRTVDCVVRRDSKTLVIKHRKAS